MSGMPKADTVHGIAGKVARLGIDDIFFFRGRVGIDRLDRILGHLLDVREQPHGVPAMVALGSVDHPVLIPHHFVEPLKNPHAEGGANSHHHQKQYRVRYFHRHG